nr:solute carrier family 35 member F1-like isoform X1 [Ipomoea batatas]
MDVNGWWGTHGNDIRRTLFLLFLGQVISFVMSLMSFTSSLLASLGVDTPLTLSFFVYLALSLVYGSIFIYRRQKLQVPWYWYLLIGFADVQGNFLGKPYIVLDIDVQIFVAVNQAFQYSSITSVTILDCWTIAWVILLTWYFLGTRYSLWQFFGAAVCVAGLGLVLLSDAGVGGGGGSRPLLGDTFVIMGTLFFALSNVGEEICVKKKDRVEVITMMAISGLLMSGATLFNLSLLTSDIYTVLTMTGSELQVDWLYYVAFGLVGIGLVVYSKT